MLPSQQTGQKESNFAKFPLFDVDVQPIVPVGSAQLRTAVFWFYGQFFSYHTCTECVNYTSQKQITQPHPIMDGIKEKHEGRAKGKKMSS